VIIDDDQVTKTAKDGQKSIARKPRTREELQKMQSLVAAAVGLEPMRGDQLTVENIAFDEPTVEETPAPTMLERITPQLKESSRVLVILGLGIFALLFIVRPLMKRAVVVPAKKMEPAAAVVPAAPPGQHIKTVEELENEIEQQLDSAANERADRRLPVLTKRVTTMSMNEPENIAKLLRTWMNEPER
jgi:flagellar M-ring protein FliF